MTDFSTALTRLWPHSDEKIPGLRAGMIASALSMGSGAYLAAKAKGREKEIAFIGIDGLPGVDGGRAMVANGQLAANSAAWLWLA